MTEENKTIEVESIAKIDAEEGDALLVTLPPIADQMPAEVRNAYIKSVQDTFSNIFQDKKVRVIIVPHGMTVELIHTSQLEDITNDASSKTE